MDQLEKAIHDHLESYFSGEMSLDEFKDWFVGATWNIEGRAAPEAIELAYAVELALAEASGGYLTTDELQEELRKLTARIPAAS